MEANDASRIIAVVDRRIERKTGAEATTETTWGEVCAISADGKYASAYLYGETEFASEGFRIPGDLALNLGDKVKVAWNGRGERWVYDVGIPSSYKKVTVNPNTGQILVGDGTAPPSTPVSLSGHNHDAAYSALGHNHDAAYSGIGHNHDATYAALSHDHSEFARFVPLDTVITNPSFASTTVDIASTVLELTALPSTGVVAVTLQALFRTGQASDGNFQVWGYQSNRTTLQGSWSIIAYGMANTNQYSTSGGVVSTGGTNNRCIAYVVDAGASGTSFYAIRVTGYWTTE